MQIWDCQNVYRELTEPHDQKGAAEKRELNKKLAAWFVSHCDTRYYREMLAKSLQKYKSTDR